MLLLTRKPDEFIDIGPDIEILVTEIKDKNGRTLPYAKVVLGITAPQTVAVHRREVYNDMVVEHGHALTPDERRRNDEPEDQKRDE